MMTFLIQDPFHFLGLIKLHPSAGLPDPLFRPGPSGIYWPVLLYLSAVSELLLVASVPRKSLFASM